jgi:hypothetical protein
MKGVKSGLFHRSGCEYIQEWMRMVSEYTLEDANSFAAPVIERRTGSIWEKHAGEAGWTSITRLTGARSSASTFILSVAMCSPTRTNSAPLVPERRGVKVNAYSLSQIRGLLNQPASLAR